MAARLVSPGAEARGLTAWYDNQYASFTERENTVSRKDKLPADAGDGQTGARGSKNYTSDALDGQQKTDDLLIESDVPAAGRLSSTQPAPLRQLAFQEDVSFEHGEGHHEAGKRDVELYIR